MTHLTNLSISTLNPRIRLALFTHDMLTMRVLCEKNQHLLRNKRFRCPMASKSSRFSKGFPIASNDTFLAVKWLVQLDRVQNQYIYVSNVSTFGKWTNANHSCSFWFVSKGDYIAKFGLKCHFLPAKSSCFEAESKMKLIHPDRAISTLKPVDAIQPAISNLCHLLQ